VPPLPLLLLVLNSAPPLALPLALAIVLTAVTVPVIGVLTVGLHLWGVRGEERGFLPLRWVHQGKSRGALFWRDLGAGCSGERVPGEAGRGGPKRGARAEGGAPAGGLVPCLASVALAVPRSPECLLACTLTRHEVRVWYTDWDKDGTRHAREWYADGTRRWRRLHFRKIRRQEANREIRKERQAAREFDRSSPICRLLTGTVLRSLRLEVSGPITYVRRMGFRSEASPEAAPEKERRASEQ